MNINPKAFKKQANLAILLAILLLISAVSYFRQLDSYESVLLDYRFLLRPPAPASDSVVIVEIGEDTVEKLGRFPFDRKYHALLINALSAFGAKAIVFDLLFTEPKENDADLEAAIRQAGNVYLASAFDLDTTKKSKVVSANGYVGKCMESFAAAAKGTGHINIVPDPDGKFRKVPLYIKYGDDLYPHLSFLAGLDSLGVNKADVRLDQGRDAVCGNKMKIPLDERSDLIVNYSGKWGKVFKHYSFVDILQTYLAPMGGEEPLLNPASFKDKVCIIGITTTGMDIHPSPFESIYPGVGIHAEIYNSMVNKKFITRVSRPMNLLILLILSLILSGVVFKTRPATGFLAFIGTIALFSIASLFLFSSFGIWIDMACPLLVIALLYLLMAAYKYLGEWKGRIASDRELDIAKKIQESFLPKELPRVNGIDIAARMITARKVGGDLYDLVEFGPGKLGVMIGDVSGKGVPASLFMAMVSGAFKSFALPMAAPEKVLFELNTKLVKESRSNLFVTVFYAIFDLTSKSFKYANGGHLPALYLAKNRTSELLNVKDGTPLGLMDGEYSGSARQFGEGDIFVFYTDGVTEAMNAKGEMYEIGRLTSLVEKYRDSTPEAMLDIIEKDLRKFEPKTTQHDDITFIVVKICVPAK
jgi:Serine phosphatase RsbU, regulator of sigma subunit